MWPRFAWPALGRTETKTHQVCQEYYECTYYLRPCSEKFTKVNRVVRIGSFGQFQCKRQTDTDCIRDCVSMQYNHIKWKFRPSEITKLSFIGKLLHKNLIFQYSDSKLNFNLFWHGFWYWNGKFRVSKIFRKLQKISRKYSTIKAKLEKWYKLIKQIIFLSFVWIWP